MKHYISFYSDPGTMVSAEDMKKRISYCLTLQSSQLTVKKANNCNQQKYMQSTMGIQRIDKFSWKKQKMQINCISKVSLEFIG